MKKHLVLPILVAGLSIAAAAQDSTDNEVSQLKAQVRALQQQSTALTLLIQALEQKLDKVSLTGSRQLCPHPLRPC